MKRRRTGLGGDARLSTLGPDTGECDFSETADEDSQATAAGVDQADQAEASSSIGNGASTGKAHPEHVHQQAPDQEWLQSFLLQLDPATQGAIAEVLRNSPGFSTAYSGGGFFESMVVQVCAALEIQPPPCWHASDLSDLCQQTLLAHRGPAAPKCIFGDICQRVPRNLA